MHSDQLNWVLGLISANLCVYLKSWGLKCILARKIYSRLSYLACLLGIHFHLACHLWIPVKGPDGQGIHGAFSAYMFIWHVGKRNTVCQAHLMDQGVARHVWICCCSRNRHIFAHAIFEHIRLAVFFLAGMFMCMLTWGIRFARHIWGIKVLHDMS